MSGMMQYLSDLIHAQLEYKVPDGIPENINLEELVEAANKNHMDNLILGALLKSDLAEEERLRIKFLVMQGTIKSMTQLACLRELEERFEKKEIYHQELKGSVLKYLYPAPELREMSDIDIMIYDESLNRAKKEVEDMGFTLHKSVKHHDIYIKPPLLVIELHHALYDRDVDRTQYEYFKDEKELEAKEGKKYALQFNTEDFYVYLIAHMAKHFYETGCGIRNIVDVYYYRKLYEETWDETAITKEIKKCGLTEFENRIHTLAAVWLGGRQPDLFSTVLFNYMMECGIYGKGENGIWGQFAVRNKNNRVNDKCNTVHGASCLAIGNKNNRASDKSYVRRWYYFPPKAYMENDYPWLKKRPYLLAAAWGIRAVHGLFSKAGREKRKMLLNIKNEDVRTISGIYKGMGLNFKKE